ncbi:MAG: NAD kinase [Bacteroidales bacterium]|jgi:NAD+ kinase|nr:NAD kinase [Bacteroidales bacterium]
MARIAVYGRAFESEKVDSYVKVLELIKKYSSEAYIHKNITDCCKEYNHELSGTFKIFDKQVDLPDTTDVIISIGGDGTFLEAVSFISDKNIPIIGVNVGRLGYLATISLDDVESAIIAIKERSYKIEERTMIQVAINDKKLNNHFALNEVAIQKKETSMIKIKTYIDDVFLNTYWADGLIISTPTGSTAYSLSVGGPIVIPGSENFVLSPIAPHNLSARPLIIPDKSVIRCKVESRDSKVLASVDNNSYVVDSDIEVIVKKASHTIKIASVEKSDYFSTLREKLLWGVDIRN